MKAARSLLALALAAAALLAPRVSAQGEGDSLGGAPVTPSVAERHRAEQLALLPRAVALLAAVPRWESGYLKPLSGRLSSPFGWRSLSVNGNNFHGGIDLAAPIGTPVRAARSGRVERAGWWGSYGNVVVLNHGDGSETRYAHLSAVLVAPGDSVRQGDVVGTVGSTGASTGPHLHFEVRFAGVAVDPLPLLEGAW